MITINGNLQKVLKLLPENADIKRVIFTDRTFDRERTVDNFPKTITIVELDEKEQLNLSWSDKYITNSLKTKSVEYIRTDSISFELTDDSLSLEEYVRNKLICTIYYKRKEE